jgi:hypothetical protein
MAFDIDQTLAGMLKAAAGVLGGEWPGVEACVRKAFQNEAAALEAIARRRLRNELTDDEMEEELKFEKDTLEADLLVCKVKTKVAAQEAVNAATAVLSSAIKGALKIL